MTEPIEQHNISVPQTDNPVEALEDVVRQINEVLLRIAQEIAAKADA